MVEQSVVHAGSFAAQSGAIDASSSSTLSVTLSGSAGEFSFWRKVSSASGSGLLVFEIDGVPVGQWSGAAAWQQSFYGVSAGKHTYTWIYSKGSGPPAGSDAAWLDDVALAPGTILTVNGTPGNDQFNFDASGGAVVVALNGEVHTFPASEFNNYVFHGGGGSDAATLTGSAAGNTALLYAGVPGTPGRSGQLNNPTAGYAVAVDGMAAIHVNGHAGDTAQFFDSPGNDTFYAYADYNQSGQTSAGMYGSYGGGYSDSASGFGTTVGNSTSGGRDTALFYDSPGNDTFYAYADYNHTGKPLAGMYGSYGGGYANSAKGFGTSVAYSTNGGSDSANLSGSSGNNTLCTDLAIAQLYGNTYSEEASGFAVVNAIAGVGGRNIKGHGLVKFQLNYLGAWISGS